MSNWGETQKISIVIPVYTEEQSLAEVLDQVCAVKLEGMDKEVVISDDGNRVNISKVVLR